MQTELPLISIIIPTFNCGTTISDTLKSVVEQSYERIEIIVVDGLSEDETLSVTKEYEKNHSNFRFISEQDKGVYDAMNKGIELAKGDYLYFMGGDDVFYSSNTLQKVFDDLDNTYDFIYGNVLFKDSKIVYSGKSSLKKLMYDQISICHQAIFYSKRAFNLIGNYNLKYFIHADYDFNIRCFKNKELNIKYIDQIIAIFNETGLSGKQSNVDGFHTELTEDISKETSVPYFSIIIPTLNSQKTLKTCLASIKSQTFQNFELLIIDGLSTDSTVAIASDYKTHNNRITIISEKDECIYSAMNKGIDMAKGDWLYFMGSDDTFYTNTVLERLAKIAITTEAKVIYGDVHILGNTGWANNGDIYDGEFTLQKLLNQNICHQAIFYNRQFILNDIGYFNLKYKKSSDWDYNLRCWSKYAFEYVTIIVANFRAGGFSTDSYDSCIEKDFLDNVLNYFKINAFHSLINNPNFIYYDKAIIKQKENHYFKYTIKRIKKSLFKSIRKLYV